MNIRTDKAQTKRFLKTLDQEAGFFTFQTFDDNSDRKDKHLARVIHGPLDDVWDQLVTLSETGAGVFVTVNATDGRGRKTENVLRVRALFVDLDGGPLEHPPRWLEPTITVQSSPGRYHCYWLVANFTPELFTYYQKALIASYGSDPCVHDLPRVMRLPGFVHQKIDEGKGLTGTPHLVTVFEQ